MNNNEPIVLGKIKKGKTGNPLIVILIFLLIGIFLVFLPTVKEYFGDNNIMTLITEGKIIDFFTNHDNYVNTNIKQNTTTQITTSNGTLINTKAIIKYNNFTLSDFVLKNDRLTYKITTSQKINFDESNYYLVLTKNDKELNYIKLTNTISDSSTIISYFSKSLSDIIEIKGTIKEINSSEYPSFILSSDESGLSSLTCLLNNDKLEYTFDNNNLLRIKETYTYKDNGDTESHYYKEFQEYTNINEKINNAGGTSNIEETDEGFVLKSNINLDSFDTKKYKNYNYYSLNTKSNIINYEMKAKGYDCK